MAQLSELSKAFFLSADPEERRIAARDALLRPAIYREIHEKYENWDLPSDTSMVVLLEREFGLQHKAIPGFLSDLKASIEYVRELGALTESGGESSDVTATAEPVRTPGPASVPEVKPEPVVTPGLMKVPMPRSASYIVLPEEFTHAEGDRIQAWLTSVIVPMIKLTAVEEPK